MTFDKGEGGGGRLMFRPATLRPTFHAITKSSEFFSLRALSPSPRPRPEGPSEEPARHVDR